MTTLRIEVFRAGKQTDSAGNSRDWTEADLEKIASGYDPKNHEAPVTIGHPKDNAPAYAWVKKVTREGKSLFAEIGDLVPEFAEMLKLKMLKKRSISLYPDLSLRHIGFLGAMPPAVKGLKDFAFADAAGAPIEYMDWSSSNLFRSVGRLLQGLRDAMLADKKEVAEVDKFLNQWDIDALKAAEAEEKPFGYHETPTEDSAMDQAKETEYKNQIASFNEQLTAEKAAHAATAGKVTTLEAKVATMEANALRAGLASFCDAQIKEGRILPAQRAQVLAFMESIAGQPAMDFTEGDKTVKKTPLELYQAQITAAPAQIAFTEFATKDKSAPAKEDDKLTQLVKAKLDADKSLTYGEASRLVLAEHADLNVAVVE